MKNCRWLNLLRSLIFPALLFEVILYCLNSNSQLISWKHLFMVSKQWCFWSACWAKSTSGSVKCGECLVTLWNVHYAWAWVVMVEGASVKGSGLIVERKGCKSASTRFWHILHWMHHRRPLWNRIIERWQMCLHRLDVQDGRAVFACRGLAWEQLTVIGEIVLVLWRWYVVV